MDIIFVVDWCSKCHQNASELHGMPYRNNIGKMGPYFKRWWQTWSKRALFSSKAPLFSAWRRLSLDWNWPSSRAPFSSIFFNLSFNNWISLSRRCTSVSAVARLSITLISRLSLSLSLSWFPIQTRHKLFNKDLWCKEIGISIIYKVHKPLFGDYSKEGISILLLCG